MAFSPRTPKLEKGPRFELCIYIYIYIECTLSKSTKPLSNEFDKRWYVVRRARGSVCLRTSFMDCKSVRLIVIT